MSVNFVVELLEFAEFNIVIIVVNLVSKRMYFILTHITITVKSIIKLFLYYIYYNLKTLELVNKQNLV